MRFCQQLNAWMVLTGCRASELCARSGVAAPSLSRYRSGERTPGRDSAVLDSLCRRLAELAQEKGVPGLTELAVRAGFLACEEYTDDRRTHLRENFNTLVEVMELRVSRLCRYANYDPSTIFRFRGGAFRNLQICIHEGQWAMVSKERSPAIHFVIRHPKLRAAIERFVPPMVEE